jgi:SAM-dependent methyltransferase
MDIRSLDLGCGATPRNLLGRGDTYGIDLKQPTSNAETNPMIKVADLAVEAIPFPNDYFDVVSAFDFLEHVPRIIYTPKRRNCFVELMSEVYRVLKPNGIFISVTPCYPHPEAFVDPTHVNIITDKSFDYFTGVSPGAKVYGFQGRFETLRNEVGVLQRYHLFSILQKKEIPVVKAD